MYMSMFFKKNTATKAPTPNWKQYRPTLLPFFPLPSPKEKVYLG